MSKFINYKKDYTRQLNIYEIIKCTLNTLLEESYNDLTNDHKKKKEITINFIGEIKKYVDAYPDRCKMLLRELGIWGLPPSEKVLSYIEKIVTENKIKTIIDYGCGIGLWSLIISNYIDKINIIAYDIVHPLNNKNVNNQYAYYEITTNHIDLTQQNDTLLMLIWPPYNSKMAHSALKKYSGNYLLFYGDKEYTGDTNFFELLNKSWTIINTYEPLSILEDELGSLTDKIYFYKKNI
jgi:hypothetical protein